MAQAAARLRRWTDLAGTALFVVAIAIMLLGLFVARARLAPRFRARNRVEQALIGLLVGCSLIAILTTVGIVVSLVFEAVGFFRLVAALDFLFGLHWEPQIAMRARPDRRRRRLRRGAALSGHDPHRASSP